MVRLNFVLSTFPNTVLFSLKGSSPSSACFSDCNTVEVLDRGTIKISELRAGDLVKTANSREEYSRVYSIAHKDKYGATDYLQITTNDGSVLEISEYHMVLVGTKATLAKDVQVGDKLDASNSQEILKIRKVKRQGRYAPLTENGQILVSGVLASNYVGLLHDQEANWQAFVYHAILVPLRLVCKFNFGLWFL